VSIDCNPASRTTTTTQVVPVSGKQSKTTVDVCKVTGTPVINRGHEPKFTSPPNFLGPATTPHSRREAAAQAKLLKKKNAHEDEEAETSSSSFLMPTSVADTAVICGMVTPATTTTPTSTATSPTTSTSTSDGSSASVTTATTPTTVTLEKCGYCKYYSYCGKECI